MDDKIKDWLSGTIKYDVEYGKCESCGKKAKIVSTSITGHQCRRCHQINIDQSNEAIKAIIGNLSSIKGG